MQQQNLKKGNIFDVLSDQWEEPNKQMKKEPFKQQDLGKQNIQKLVGGGFEAVEKPKQHSSAGMRRDEGTTHNLGGGGESLAQ